MQIHLVLVIMELSLPFVPFPLIHGMERDLEAITNAITTKLSSGMVEGNVNRLKYIKRQMYGRASIGAMNRTVNGTPTGGVARTK